MKATILTIDGAGNLVSNVAIEIDGSNAQIGSPAYEAAVRAFFTGFASNVQIGNSVTTEPATLAPTEEPVAVPTEEPVETNPVPPEDQVAAMTVDLDKELPQMGTEVTECCEVTAEDDEGDEEDKSESESTAELINIEEKDAYIKRLNANDSVRVAITDDLMNYLYVDDLVARDGFTRFRFGETFYTVRVTDEASTISLVVTIDNEDHEIKFNIINTSDEEGEYAASISRKFLEKVEG